MALDKWSDVQHAEFKELAQKTPAVLASLLVDKNRELAEAKSKIAALEHRLSMFNIPKGGSITIN